jgi:hypothetical protein
MSISPLRKAVSQPIPRPPIDEGRDQPLLSFHFKEITPEDWRANEAPLADLYQRGIVSGEYVRRRLKIPEEAGSGTMALGLSQPAKPPDDIRSEVPERWRLKQTKRGVIAERIE